MAVNGYQFDRSKVSAANDANLYDYLNACTSKVLPNRGDELDIIVGTGDVVIQTGTALIQGRLVEITEPLVITLPNAVDGYISITLDLTQINSSSGTPGQSDYSVINNQLRVEFVTTLIQGDTLNNDLIYTFPLASIEWSSGELNAIKNEEAYSEIFGIPYIYPSLNSGVSIISEDYLPGFRMKRGRLQMKGALITNGPRTLFVLPPEIIVKERMGFTLAQVSSVANEKATIYLHTDNRVELLAATNYTKGVWLAIDIDIT
ncbi:hypothetical protein HCA89_00405 [Listeria innocua]|uniref:Uncharacterized protein n=1 Tax=Listeria innocua TaxID=1642 RepID=A0AB73H4G6_LISIO|nr:hypothetical protein [Listeria innocua]MBC2140753.1 hypothetical protein [Listeria innocua]